MHTESEPIGEELSICAFRKLLGSPLLAGHLGRISCLWLFTDLINLLGISTFTRHGSYSLSFELLSMPMPQTWLKGSCGKPDLMSSVRICHHWPLWNTQLTFCLLSWDVVPELCPAQSKLFQTGLVFTPLCTPKLLEKALAIEVLNMD
jgi:hypothetical protein